MPTTDLKVAMACGGCAAAVKKVLLATPGVTGVDVDLDAQKVSVQGDASADTIVAAVKASGKAVSLWK
jgi:copper chaperone